jgi:hypothetical protein
MRIVVSDSSCLIDLRKASLLDALVRLPYELLIPNTLFGDGLLRFTAAEKGALLRAGLQVVDLRGDRVTRAVEVSREAPRVSIHHGFAFALAEQHEGCVLLSGDQALRACTATCAMEVRGVLWFIDELHRDDIVPVAALLDALTLFATDATVRLPAREVAAFIRRIRRCANLEWVGLVRSGQRRPERPPSSVPDSGARRCAAHRRRLSRSVQPRQQPVLPRHVAPVDDALLGHGPRARQFALALECVEKDEFEQVALSVAAAHFLHPGHHRLQLVHGFGVAALPGGAQAARGRQCHLLPGAANVGVDGGGVGLQPLQLGLHRGRRGSAVR